VPAPGPSVSGRTPRVEDRLHGLRGSGELRGKIGQLVAAGTNLGRDREQLVPQASVVLRS